MALALPVLFALLMGILELGMAFNAYVTLQSAAREGARAGAIYLFDSSLAATPSDNIAVNDQRREAFVRDTVVSSMGVLKTTTPNFDPNTDVVIGYVHDPTLPTLDTRTGDLITVQVTYRHDLLSKVLSDNPIITMTVRAEARIE
jgi:Flp pilus assembly protein TadG